MIDDEKKARRPLLAFLLVTLAVGALGSVVTTPAIPGWYAGLNHPAIAPPNWVFAPVWTTLYVMMAVAAWRAWKVARVPARALVSLQRALAVELQQALAHRRHVRFELRALRVGV